MRKNSSTSSSKRIFVLTALVFCLLSLMVESSIVAFVDRYCTNTSYMLYRHNLKQLESTQSKVDFVFVGDSSLRSSIAPKVFQEISGEKAVNLGMVMASGIMSDFYLVERYIERHGPPNSVVMVHTSDALATDFSRALYVTHFADFAENQSLYAEGFFDFQETVDAHLRATLPSYRYALYAKRALQPLVRWDVKQMQTNGKEVQTFRKARTSLGYFPAPKEGIIPGEVKNAQARKFTAHPTNTYYLERLLRLTKEYGIPLYYAHGPLYDAHARVLNRSQYLTGLNQYLDEYSNNYSHFKVLQRELPAFPKAELGDGSTHLNEAGARRFSRMLVRLLELEQK